MCLGSARKRLWEEVGRQDSGHLGWWSGGVPCDLGFQFQSSSLPGPQPGAPGIGRQVGQQRPPQEVQEGLLVLLFACFSLW